MLSRVTNIKVKQKPKQPPHQTYGGKIMKKILVPLIVILFLILMVGAAADESPMIKSIKVEQQKHDTDNINNVLMWINLFPYDKKKVTEQVKHKIAEETLKKSKKYEIEPELIISIIHQESEFYPMAKSSTGCLGLMQIHWKVHRDKLKKLGITSVKDVYKISNNIEIGCMIYKENYKSTESIKAALKRYNACPTYKYSNLILKKYNKIKDLS
jgi:soluble lytic murein transglycosylase-like protein